MRWISPCAFAFALPLVVAGCSKEESSDVDTSNLRVHFETTLTDGAGKTHMDTTVFLHKGDDTFTDVDLSNGDELHVLTDKGLDLVPSRFSAGQFVLHTDLVDPGLITLELRRTSKPSALHTTAKPQPALALGSSSPAGKTFRADDKLELQWSNPLSSGVLYLQPHASPCGGAQLGGQAADVRLTDTGTGSVRAGDLLQGAPPAEGVCMSLTIQRAGGSETAIDPGLYKKSGAAEGANDTSYVKVWRNTSYEFKIVP